MGHTEDLWKRKDGSKRPNYGKGHRWRATWVEPDGRRKSQVFKTKDAAQAKVTAVEHQQRAGEYVPQANRRVPVSDLLPLWEASLIRLKPSTLRQLRWEVEASILPKWGGYQVGGVTRQHVQAWVHELHGSGLAARTVDTKFGKLRSFYAWCVREGHVPVSPCAGITLPRGHGREHVFLTPAQVRDLLEHMHEHHKPLTEFLFTTGARFGEAVELRGKDLDLDARRATIARSFTNGHVTLPKSHKRRTVPLTGRMTDTLRELTVGKGRDDLVFTTTRGNRVTLANWRTLYWLPAVGASNVPKDLRIHDARHTACSLAIASGANVKVIQRMLGHASAALTLSVYAGLFSSDLDEVADRMGELLK